MVQTKSQKAEIDTQAAASVLSGPTARPWRVADMCFGELWVTGPSVTLPICMVTAAGEATDRELADAALIVRAVNNHDALVRALANLLELAEHGDFKNGVTHNCIDEGEVFASGVMDVARTALNSVSESNVPGNDRFLSGVASEPDSLS